MSHRITAEETKTGTGNSLRVIIPYASPLRPGDPGCPGAPGNPGVPGIPITPISPLEPTAVTGQTVLKNHNC